MALGLGSFAAAAEEGEPTPTPKTTTEAPLVPDEGDSDVDEGDDEATDDDATDDDSESGGGLVCEFVPVSIEGEDVRDGTDEDVLAEEEAPETTTPTSPTIEEYLATGDIQCTGTGNERSASVALVPRFLARSELWSGREKGAAISEWAKTHANKKSLDQEDTGDDTGEVPTTDTGGASAEHSKSSANGQPASPGKSGEAKATHKKK